MQLAAQCLKLSKSVLSVSLALVVILLELFVCFFFELESEKRRPLELKLNPEFYEIKTRKHQRSMGAILSQSLMRG